MILFQDDFISYPTAFIDTTAPNDSFMKYSLLLKAMKIKNHLFPLVTIHPELRNVDPFDPNLSVEQKVTIGIECQINPWYFFRRCVVVPGHSLETPMYFLANRSNIAIYWLFFNHITSCLTQPRQTGKSFEVNVLDTFLLNVGSKGNRTLLLTKDETLRAKTLTEIKTLTDLLPPYLQQHNKTDIGNREEINVSSLDNNYKGLIARNDPMAADKTGRGHTVSCTRTDEFAYLFYNEIAVRTMLAATTAARKTAELRGNPYGNIFMTTAGKKDDKSGAFAYEYINSAAPWTEFFFDCKDRDELRNAVRSSSKDSKTLRIHLCFSHRQLGYTDDWLRETASENNSYGEAFERDYLNIWTSGSQNSPFTIEEAKKIRESETEIKFADISKFGQIVTRWYYPEDQIKRIMLTEYTVMGVDTSDGMGKDDIAIVIRHLKTGEVLGACSLNEINLITVSNFLVDFLKTYINCTMIIERRNQAATIVDYMHKQMIILRIDPFKRIFNTCVQDHVEFPDRYTEIQKSYNALNENFLAQYKRYFGFVTSGSGITSRSELYGTTLKQAIRYTGDLIRDKSTINQLLSLIIKNGRVDHPHGGQDDLCIAYLLTYFFMSQGRNLQYYGIPSGYILSQNQIIHSASNKEEVYQNDLARRAKAHIDMLINMIKQEKDKNVIERLMMEIENVKNILGPHHEISLSVDDMISQLKKTKMTKSYLKQSMFY